MSDLTELDARRLLCPLPVIRLQDCVNQQARGRAFASPAPTRAR